MPASTPTCAVLKESLADVRTRKDELDALLTDAAVTHDYTLARAKKSELDTRIASLQEAVNPFERILGFREQYERSVSALRVAGLLETFADGREGIRSLPDTDNPAGREYPLLTQREVVERMREKRELFLEKAREGFTELTIVPFALPLEKMKDAYGARLTYWNTKPDGGIFPEARAEGDTRLKLGTSPVYLSSEYTNIRYGTTSLAEADKKTKWGKTKADLLKEDPANAWTVYLTKPDPIPRAGKGGTGTKAKDYEAGKSPNEYLALLAKNREVGLTPEWWLAAALARLETNQAVLDDAYSGGRGSLSYLLGACIETTTGSARAPCGYWYRGGGQAYLGWFDAANTYPAYGCRSGVGV